MLHQDVHAAGERLPQSDPRGHILDIGDLRELWLQLGMRDVQVKRLSLGGAVVMWGTKSGPDQKLGTMVR